MTKAILVLVWGLFLIGLGVVGLISQPHGSIGMYGAGLDLVLGGGVVRGSFTRIDRAMDALLA